MTYQPNQPLTAYQLMCKEWLDRRDAIKAEPVATPPHCERKAAEISLGIEEMAEFGLRFAAGHTQKGEQA